MNYEEITPQWITDQMLDFQIIFFTFKNSNSWQI